MLWLLRRILVVWAIMTLMYAVVAVSVRLNRVPDRLQALGFGVCDGEP
jgi:hypothetical protein